MGYDVFCRIGFGHQIEEDQKENFWAIVNELIPGASFEYDDGPFDGGPFITRSDGSIEWIDTVTLLTFDLPNGKSLALEYYTADDEHVADSNAAFFGIKCDGFSLPQLMELDLISQSP